MGRKKRTIPKFLGSKLKDVRLHLNFSQTDMLRVIKPGESYKHRSMISEFENSTNAPDLCALLVYARAANVTVESLIDDSIKLDLLNKKLFKEVSHDGESNYLKQSDSIDNAEPTAALIQFLTINNLSPDCDKNREAIPTNEHSCFSSNELSAKETISVELADKFLDDLDDLYLDFLRDAPRHLRLQMTRDYFYRALFLSAVNDFNVHKEKSYPMQYWQKLAERLSTNNEPT